MADQSVSTDMRMMLQYGLFRAAFWTLGAVAVMSSLLSNAGQVKAADGLSAGSAHAFTFESIEGGGLPLSDFRGKAVLVVNTASFCGFTHQYRGLQALWEKYRDRGLVVLGVPSNDFGSQEPGTAQEIKEFCDTNYHIDFPLTDKVHVKGDGAHPFYRWMVDQLGPRRAPRWNFHKYLIDADGVPVDAYATHVRPEDRSLIAAIEAVLPD